MSEEGDTEGEGNDEPFGDFLEEIDRRRREDGADQFDALDDAEGDWPRDSEGGTEPGTGLEELFTDESFDELETDDLWEEIADRDPSAGAVGGEADGDPAIVEEAETHVVPKRTFCETCPHLTEPPDFRCTHEGTEIVSFVDMDHVRVRDCPIVEERRVNDR